MKHARQLVCIGLVLLASAALASAIPGRAEVKKVVGSATITKAAGSSASITVGMVLGTGDTINTGPGSIVDLYLGLNGDLLRVDADTTLKLDVLDIGNISQRTVTTSMSLSKGNVTGNVIAKLTAASKYEIKTAAGVAGIRGTVYSLSAAGRLVVAKGSVTFNFTLNGVQQSVTVGVGQQFKIGDAKPTAADKFEILEIGVTAANMARPIGDIIDVVNGGTITDTGNPLSVSVSQ